ncbi:hypothetical protein WJX72_003847 [[Myrmecia] bisecta]|uniref:Peptide deformylase n=1 Tax=[Myrmecia] bisecta TaxID=41462 RepID=A0AAW1PWE9_9CHLO
MAPVLGRSLHSLQQVQPGTGSTQVQQAQQPLQPHWTDALLQRNLPLTLARGRTRTGARKNRLLLELAETHAESAADKEDAATPVAESLEWESPLSIIRYPDPRLRAVNARIGVFDERLKQLAAEMFDVMYNGDDGVGLAAPQVGVNVRLMVFNPEGKDGKEEYILVNPRIVSVNKGTDVMEEGCLSFPKTFADVERPTTVKIKAQDVNGKKVSLTFRGWPARIFQHEYDHLQGTLFHDRMQPEALASIKPKLKQLETDFMQKHPGVQIRTVD